MKVVWVILLATTVALVGCLLVWLNPGSAASNAAPSTDSTEVSGEPLRIGLVPERDIFRQRKRYQVLAAYLSERLERPVELVTLNTYQSVLDDFAEKQIDAAFLGSLVASLSMDRLGTEVLAKPEMLDGVSTYRGVIFVREDSPLQSVDDLPGHTVVMVRTTTAGHLFPIFLMRQRGILDRPDTPTLHWAGTHDDAILHVTEGRFEAGAAKDLRLDAYERANPDQKIRRLAVGKAVPNNGLVVRADLDPTLRERLKELLLTMDQTPEGRKALKALGAKRFLSCEVEEYAAIYEMVAQMGEDWERLGIPGSPPRRPVSE